MQYALFLGALASHHFVVRERGSWLMLLRLQQEMMVINETIPIQINTLWRSMNDERLLKELVQGAMG